MAVKVLYGRDDSDESTDPMEELIEEIKIMRYGTLLPVHCLSPY